MKHLPDLPVGPSVLEALCLSKYERSRKRAVMIEFSGELSAFSSSPLKAAKANCWSFQFFSYNRAAGVVKLDKILLQTLHCIVND